MATSSHSPHWRGRLKTLVDKVSKGLGFNRPRKVRFQEQANVFEFERQLAGGGGVPEHDSMALGLGPKLVSAYSLPLAEKQGKDDYASTGYLDIEERTRLLAQWEKKRALEVRLSREVGPELEELQRLRTETAQSPKDQRYMPTNAEEAIEVASKDEAFAKKVVSVKLKSRRTHWPAAPGARPWSRAPVMTRRPAAPCAGRCAVAR